MKNLTLENIAKACKGTYYGAETDKTKEIEHVVIDSRQVQPGDLFVAIPGERVDGHKFVKTVLEQGAYAAMVEKMPEEGLDTYEGALILVNSTAQALKDLAEYYLAGLDVKVVGITGSVGKTSTKEAIASVLSQKYQVLKTAGNFNNEIGLPLTVFRIREEHEVAVLEMGISEFGEMERLAKIAKPDIAVITNIGICHLENLKTRDGILQEKSTMMQFLKPGGCAILNGDDDKLQTLKGQVSYPIRYFGRKEEESFTAYATEVKNLGLDGVAMQIHCSQGSFDARIGIPGEHNVYNALAATCVGLELGLSTEEIQKGLKEAKTISGRINLIHHKDMIFIDDCYNANPVSMKEALKVLDTATGRKIAVLGDMGELGVEEKELHADVGAFFAESQIDVAFVAGSLMENFATCAKEKNPQKEIYVFSDRESLTKALLPYVKKGDAILVKASHFMEFPKILEALQQL